jgi:hypothetical protein
LDVLAGRARVVARRKQVAVDAPLRALRAGALFTRKVNDRRHVPLMIDHGSLLILESRLLKHDRARYLRASDAVGGRIFAGKHRIY